MYKRHSSLRIIFAQVNKVAAMARKYGVIMGVASRTKLLTFDVCWSADPERNQTKHFSVFAYSPLFQSSVQVAWTRGFQDCSKCWLLVLTVRMSVMISTSFIKTYFHVLSFTILHVLGILKTSLSSAHFRNDLCSRQKREDSCWKPHLIVKVCQRTWKLSQEYMPCIASQKTFDVKILLALCL